MPTDEQLSALEQAQACVAGHSPPYTLTAEDIEGIRRLLSQLIESDLLSGPYCITSMQGYSTKASAVVEYERGAGPEINTRALELQIESSAKLGQVAKKVLADWDTNHERWAKLEAFVTAFDTLRGMPGMSVPQMTLEQYAERMGALEAAREALG